MQSSFTSESAAANLRRRRAVQSEDAGPSEEPYLPRLSSRALIAEPTGQHRTVRDDRLDAGHVRGAAGDLVMPGATTDPNDAPLVDYWYGAATETGELGGELVEQVFRQSADQNDDLWAEPAMSMSAGAYSVRPGGRPPGPEANRRMPVDPRADDDVPMGRPGRNVNGGLSDRRADPIDRG